ncbi:MAG: ribosome biogenesis GTP-binding protein YihA/YsxC [Flavobacteriales bacterium]|jgi:GTP-binding protein|nr:ribosome biogenesis GTP-binding protein YihA/YsxC [Flavobacteriales bacterium]MDP7430576.1 ribosome biogenesis GTP-binding protein YihA/YsxC [Flavobacteriales bacterium]HJN64246.1 ribosome biogenesis GTP-binding protein YihA/YsxC [Flavobacteriales bacterium]|tara:strand:+ start:16725 stop:17327 length:603 start_codon:yes stop_codon:yes gene_type:complete
MQIKSSDFIISNTDYTLCPKADMPEYAFIGRSNVGKSSLINLITNKKQLAKISGKPGKTQLINHFLINKEWYLVDLPGYGYATVSKTQKQEFQKIIFSYLENRENLMCLFVLLDCRHKPQKIDLEFMKWLGEKQIPFLMIFTKIDKLGKTELKKNIENYKTEMLKQWEEIPQTFFASVPKRKGSKEILDFIEKTNLLFTS